MYFLNMRGFISTRISSVFFIFVLTQIVYACSGGETATGVTSDSDTKTVIGPVTSNGDFVVNGINFDTNDTQITIDSETANKDELSPGMIVEINGRINDDGKSGTAYTINGMIEVKGYITGIDYNYLSVMGQEIILNENTMFLSDDPEIRKISQLSSKDYVAVSGHATGNGIIYATLILHKADANNTTVKGIINNFDGSSFTIGGLLINITSATTYDRIKENEIDDGLYVSIDSTDFIISDGMDAERIKKEGSKSATEGVSYKLDGIVTTSSVTQDNTFVLAGHTITVDETAVFFENGDKDSIQAGTRLRLDGVALQDGTIQASYILFVLPSTLKIRTELLNPDDLDTSTNALVLINSLIKTDLFTIFKDDLAIEDISDSIVTSLSNLQAGDMLEIRAYVEPLTGSLIASKFTRKKYDARRLGETEIEGYIGSNMDINNKTITIDGISIDYSQTDTELESSDAGRKAKGRGYYDYDNNILVAHTFGLRK